MEKLIIDGCIVSVAQTNCYFVRREDRKDVIVFDPGDSGTEICRYLTEQGMKVSAICITHGHFDHFMGAEDLQKAAEKENGEKPLIYAPEADIPVFSDPRLNSSASFCGRQAVLDADVWVKDGQELELSGIRMKVFSTPGHTAGGCCFYLEDDQVLISGDTLFRESVGRTDLPTGNMDTLEETIRTKLFVLPDETTVYPGHMGTTSIGHEKKYNPFVR